MGVLNNAESTGCPASLPTARAWLCTAHSMPWRPGLQLSLPRCPGPADTDGHGTGVAGAAAAVGNNLLGVTGIAWQVGGGSAVPLCRESSAHPGPGRDTPEEAPSSFQAPGTRQPTAGATTSRTAQPTASSCRAHTHTRCPPPAMLRTLLLHPAGQDLGVQGVTDPGRQRARHPCGQRHRRVPGAVPTGGWVWVWAQHSYFPNPARGAPGFLGGEWGPQSRA